MTRTFSCALGLLALALGGTLRAQQYDDVRSASYSDLSNLEARLANLEARAATTNNNIGGGSGGCCDGCCGNSGFITGGEIAWLKAYNSDGDFGDFNFRAGYRFWAGWQRDDGLGFRIRYFDYFQRTNATNDVLDIYYVDFEVYDRVQLGCYWDLYIGGGFRVLGYQDTNSNNALDGVGPEVSAELYRHIGQSAALYAIGRQSLIVGSDRLQGNQDTTGSVTELQLGLQVHRDWNNALVFARAGWETQGYYDIHQGDELVTLMGGVLSLGIMR